EEGGDGQREQPGPRGIDHAWVLWSESLGAPHVGPARPRAARGEVSPAPSWCRLFYVTRKAATGNRLLWTRAGPSCYCRGLTEKMLAPGARPRVSSTRAVS